MIAVLSPAPKLPQNRCVRHGCAPPVAPHQQKSPTIHLRHRPGEDLTNRFSASIERNGRVAASSLARPSFGLLIRRSGKRYGIVVCRARKWLEISVVCRILAIVKMTGESRPDQHGDREHRRVFNRRGFKPSTPLRRRQSPLPAQAPCSMQCSKEQCGCRSVLRLPFRRLEGGGRSGRTALPP